MAATGGHPAANSATPWQKGGDAPRATDAKGAKKGKAETKGKADTKGKTLDGGMSSDVSRFGAAAGATVPSWKGKEMKGGAPNASAAGHAADTAGKGALSQKGKPPAVDNWARSCPSGGSGAAATVSATAGKGKTGKAAGTGHAAGKAKGGKMGDPWLPGRPLEFTSESVRMSLVELLKVIVPLTGRWSEDGQPMVELTIGRHTLNHVIQAAERYAKTLPSNRSVPAEDEPAQSLSKSLPEQAQEDAGSDTSSATASPNSWQNSWQNSWKRDWPPIRKNSWSGNAASKEQAWTASEQDKEEVKEEAAPQSADPPTSQARSQAADSGSPGGKFKRLFTGTIQELHLEHEYGVVESGDVRQQYNRDPFIHLGQLTVEGENSPMAKKGDRLIFALEQDEENNLWTWEPIIPTNREFIGSVRLWNNNLQVGQIRCDELMETTGQDVTVNSQCFQGQMGPVDVNTKLSFCVILNGIGRLQAAHAKRIGSDEEKPWESDEKQPWKKLRPNELAGKGQKAGSTPPSTTQTGSSDAEARKKALQEELRRKKSEEIERVKAKEASGTPATTWAAQPAAPSSGPATASKGPEVQAKLDQWVAAKRKRAWPEADKIREELRAIGVEPDEALVWGKDRWR